MTNETLRQAMRRAFNFGQTYWQQADSDFISHHKKADETKAKFEALVEETCAAIDAEQAKGREAVASSACPICGKDEVHQHGIESTAEWLRNQARRFWGAEADKFIRINTSEVDLIDALRREIKVLDAKIEDLKPETSYENYCKSDAELRALRTTPPAQPAREWSVITEGTAAAYLHDLCEALNNAFISTWQSTHAWQKQLDAANEYLREKNAGQPVVKEN